MFDYLLRRGRVVVSGATGAESVVGGSRRQSALPHLGHEVVSAMAPQTRQSFMGFISG
jgi:hypothetical protein